MSGGTKIKILVQVEDNEPCHIGTAEINPTSLQADLEQVFMELVKFIRTTPLKGMSDVMD